VLHINIRTYHFNCHHIDYRNGINVYRMFQCCAKKCYAKI